MIGAELHYRHNNIFIQTKDGKNKHWLNHTNAVTMSYQEFFRGGGDPLAVYEKKAGLFTPKNKITKWSFSFVNFNSFDLKKVEGTKTVG